jgi:hypothetical protein
MCCKQTSGAQALLSEAHRNLDNALTAVTRLQEELARVNAPDVSGWTGDVLGEIEHAREQLSKAHAFLAAKNVVR